MGDHVTAQSHFDLSLAPFDKNNSVVQAQNLMQKAFVHICRNENEEANRLLREAYELQPSNRQVTNNLAVVSLYLGNLTEALCLLESVCLPDSNSRLPKEAGRSLQGSDPLSAVHSPPNPFVLNLAVLYEVHSDRAVDKKVRLLEEVARMPGEMVDPVNFKLAI
ncbi:unnamed protein product [Protopolystoma xenopodis]|uniref:Uncharacterized protein n=1 Tax=Protopolystoma xenopodis TaxID=117903 RepID=A0A3S5BNY6_9PLAT|nr:unnamed protein product [Protopolystoma xenopodis]